MRVKLTVIGSASIALAILVGCATTQKPKELPSIEVTYGMPTLTPAENTSQDQEKHGIRISVLPYTFSATKKVRCQYKRLPTLFVVNDQYSFEMKEIAYYEVNPEQVQFKIKVYNNLGHVLRLAGTVISFQVAGKMVALDKSGYEDFLNGIVLPRQEMEYEIVGPSINSLPDSCTIALLLYDIVTKTDAAGNPTERTNFEQFYTYSKEIVTKSETVNVQKVMMTPAEARKAGAWEE